MPYHVKQTSPNAVISCSGWEIPRYWDASYQAAYGQFIAALGRR